MTFTRDGWLTSWLFWRRRLRVFSSTDSITELACVVCVVGCCCWGAGCSARSARSARSSSVGSMTASEAPTEVEFSTSSKMSLEMKWRENKLLRARSCARSCVRGRSDIGHRRECHIASAWHDKGSHLSHLTRRTNLDLGVSTYTLHHRPNSRGNWL